eukprot:6481679-Amphidinium_carterae.1
MLPGGAMNYMIEFPDPSRSRLLRCNSVYIGQPWSTATCKMCQQSPKPKSQQKKKKKKKKLSLFVPLLLVAV